MKLLLLMIKGVYKHVVAIDALYFGSRKRDQYTCENELNKSFCGFEKNSLEGSIVPLATGNWGCGGVLNFNPFKDESTSNTISRKKIGGCDPGSIFLVDKYYMSKIPIGAEVTSSDSDFRLHVGCLDLLIFVCMLFVWICWIY